MTVSNNEPINKPGRFDSPNEIAPSSRKGKTTKYALKICKTKLKMLKGSRRRLWKWHSIENWDEKLTKKKQKNEWRRAEDSCGYTVTNTDTSASNRDLPIVFLFSDRRQEEEEKSNKFIFFLVSQSQIVMHVRDKLQQNTQNTLSANHTWVWVNVLDLSLLKSTWIEFA